MLWWNGGIVLLSVLILESVRVGVIGVDVQLQADQADTETPPVPPWNGIFFPVSTCALDPRPGRLIHDLHTRPLIYP